MRSRKPKAHQSGMVEVLMQSMWLLVVGPQPRAASFAGLEVA